MSSSITTLLAATFVEPAIMRVLICLILLVFVQGCLNDPYARLCTTEQPQTNDLVGRYTLKDQTITSGGLSALRGRSCVVALAADGTFTATNIPPLTSGAPINSLNSLVSGSGTWRLDSVGSVDVDGRGQVKTHWGVRLDSPTAMLQAPGLTGNQPPYGLIFSVGDPDTLTVMIFERSK